MEVYVSEKEIPENCAECIYYNNHKCFIDNNGYKWTTQAPIQKNKLCPINSLEQHDRELLEEFAENIIKHLDFLTRHGYTDDQWEEVCISKGDVEDLIKRLLKERGVE